MSQLHLMYGIDLTSTKAMALTGIVARSNDKHVFNCVCICKYKLKLVCIIYNFRWIDNNMNPRIGTQDGQQI